MVILFGLFVCQSVFEQLLLAFIYYLYLKYIAFLDLKLLVYEARIKSYLRHTSISTSYEGSLSYRLLGYFTCLLNMLGDTWQVRMSVQLFIIKSNNLQES